MSGELNVISFKRATISGWRSEPRGAPADYLHQQNVFGRCGPEEWEDRWVAEVAAVPIGHAVDLDRADRYGSKQKPRSRRR